MSIYKGTTQIASGTTQFQTNAGWNLFDCKWSDHLISDQSWLRSDTFSWQNGTTYSTAYNHLVSDISGITAETETIGSYTVTFYRASDGHKICLANQETTVSNIFSESGIAWYYILDTDNTQFKLPRTKWSFEGLRDTVGNKIDESLPNIKAYITGSQGSSGTSGTGMGIFRNSGGAFALSALYKVCPSPNSSGWAGTNYNAYGDANIDASRYSSTYQDNAPVQERATQMYLYFYVGEYTQTAIQQTAGLNSELFNGKVDLNANNLSTTGKSLISGYSMPSNRYINLTLGASGTTYTAPANGWFTSYFSCTAAQIGTWVNLSLGCSNSGSTAGSYDYVGTTIPAKSGDTVVYYYNHPTANSIKFTFVYAQGDE